MSVRDVAREEEPSRAPSFRPFFGRKGGIARSPQARNRAVRDQLQERLNQVHDIVRAVHEGQYAPIVEG
jgi:hypothetical protein